MSMRSAIPRERGQQKGPKQGSFDYGRSEPDSKNTFSQLHAVVFRSRNAPTVAQRVPWPAGLAGPPRVPCLPSVPARDWSRCGPLLVATGSCTLAAGISRAAG